MELAGSFSPQAYEHQVRPSMMPPHVQFDDFSGLMSWEHAAPHGSVDAACARFGFPIYEMLRKQYAAKADGHLRVWRCSHFGGHQFAPTLLDLPEGRYWGHLEPEILDILVYRHGSPFDLRPFYRGWAGLSCFITYLPDHAHELQPVDRLLQLP